jgi:putative membrane protein
MNARNLFSLSLSLPFAVMMSAIANADPASSQTEGWHMGWGMGHGMLGGFWMIIFWVGLIALIIWAVRAFTGSADRVPGPASSKTPLEILRERFARGEIDKNEFEDRKHHLSQ